MSFEKEGNVIVKAELPGLCKEDIEITATEDGISLKGEFRGKRKPSRRALQARTSRREVLRTIAVPAGHQTRPGKGGIQGWRAGDHRAMAEETKPRNVR